MTSLRRIFGRLIIFALILALLIGAAGYWYVQKLLRELTPRLEAALSDAFEAEVKIAKSRLQYDRGLGIVVHDVEVARSKNCTAPLKVGRIALHLSVPELLRRRLVIRQLAVRGIDLQLAVDKAGQVAFLFERRADCEGSAPVAAPSAPVPAGSQPSSGFVLDLSIEAIDVSQLNARIQLPHGDVRIDNLNGTSGLNLSDSAVRLDNLHLHGTVLDQELELSLRELAGVRPDKSLSLNGLDLKYGRSTLRGNFSLRLVEGDVPVQQGVMDITAINAELQELDPLAAALGMKSSKLSGSLSGAVKLEVADSTTLRGDVTLKNFKQGERLAAGLLSLTSLQLEGKGVQVLGASAQLSARGVFIRDARDRYEAQSLEGSLTYENGKKFGLHSPQLAFTGFLFSDGTTEVSDVNAVLSAVSVTRNTKGDVRLMTKLSGSKLNLRHFDHSVSPPAVDFEVRQIGSASVPLQVSVPQAGGYSVRGPVSVTGGSLVWASREFRKVSGTVDMLVSGPLKKFSAKTIAFDLGKEAGKLSGTFEMTPQRYALPKWTLNIAGGKAAADFTLSRQEKRSAAANLKCQAIDLGRLLPAVSLSGEKSLEGIVREGSFSARANWGDLKGTAQGSGAVFVSEGQDTRVDFTKLLGRALRMIPGVKSSGGGESGAERAERPAQTVRLAYVIKPGMVEFKSIELQRVDYSLRGDGTLSFDGEIKVPARVTFLKENLGALGSGLQTVTGLFGGLTRVDVPIRISGKIPNISVDVDTKTFFKEKSGISTAESIIDSTGNIIGGVGRAIVSPFSRGTPASQATSIPQPAP